MDDDKDGKDNKTIFEKITDAFNNVVDTASAAATKATDPDPEIGRGEGERTGIGRRRGHNPGSCPSR